MLVCHSLFDVCGRLLRSSKFGASFLNLNLTGYRAAKISFVIKAFIIIWFIDNALYYNLFYLRIVVVKEDEMGRACSTNGEKMNAYRILVVKPEGKRPQGRPRLRWVDSIKIDLREIGWDGLDWIDLAQDRD
jgi:hypothetical protein